ncbi:Sugar kinase [Granulibacter bethesdensis]|nr:bifunctional ADP-dependent NAD(P)H-hydrate dehydratase/NAD(P)H-hydrate epimerase [Granulibacter bethesdensis]APH59641.1 Sugar kinase [Granulibacter bethesdensis]
MKDVNGFSALPDHALLTPHSMALADRQAALLDAARMDVPGSGLMEHAGAAVARLVRRLASPCRVLVMAGPGNNGGDGYVAARKLQQAGWPVTVAALLPPRPGSDAARAASRWNGPVITTGIEAIRKYDLVIDAVFGAGLSKPLDSFVSEMLGNAAAKADGRVIAVDVPSGLDGATGQPMGKVTQAQATITFVRCKPGHYLMPGKSLCGDVILADIGMPAAVLNGISADAWLNGPALWHLPVVTAESHKYSRGHVTVLGGTTMPGAARLASAAARRAGAGLVSIATGHEAAWGYRFGEPGLIVTDEAIATLLQDRRRHVWVCGPGLEPEAAGAALRQLVDAGRQVVADAGVFSWAANHPLHLKGTAVLTPHEGEFTRVFGAIGGDKLKAAREAAVQTNAVIILKGSDTVIAAPDGRTAINASAPPWLGTAGAGDVLSGIVAALLAQGMERWEAACAAVFLHGRAAALAGPGMCAEDLIPCLANAEADARNGIEHPLRRFRRKSKGENPFSALSATHGIAGLHGLR